RLRSGGTFPGPIDAGGEVENPLAIAPEEARVPNVVGRGPARRHAGQGFARLPSGEQRRLAAPHNRPTFTTRATGNRIHGRLPSDSPVGLSMNQASQIRMTNDE